MLFEAASANSLRRNCKPPTTMAPATQRTALPTADLMLPQPRSIPSPDLAAPFDLAPRPLARRADPESSM